ncbi:MAG: hypothetical protein P4L99_00475 [Chthoniobacter sp.]|nr:hypothetical protein [Chthoniobacter sp.]
MATPLRKRANDLKLVLVLAVLLLLGALVLLSTSQPVIAFHQSYRWLPSGADVAPPGLLHFYGFAGFLASVFLFRLYFKVRRQRHSEMERLSRRQ